MSKPDCVISVRFTPPDQFEYVVESCAPGWQVSEHGNIRPPSRSRVIYFEFEDAEAAGLQVSVYPPRQPFPDDEPFWNDSDGQAENSRDPTAVNILILDIVGERQELAYRVGVRTGNVIVWDDPKIYNEPDE